MTATKIRIALVVLALVVLTLERVGIDRQLYPPASSSASTSLAEASGGSPPPLHERGSSRSASF